MTDLPPPSIDAQIDACMIAANADVTWECLGDTVRRDLRAAADCLRQVRDGKLVPKEEQR